MKIEKGRCVWAGVAAVLCCSTALDVLAQTAASGLEEIVVTARKRDESSLDVPVAVTAS